MTRGDSLKLAAVAHDLRTPLGAITLKARYLLDSLLPTDSEHRRAREEVEGIVRGARMMERLIHDLLDASSIDARTFRIAPAVHDTETLVADAADAMTALATHKHVSLASNLDNRRITCDRDRLIQVLINLLGNAVKFTPAGGAHAITDAHGGRIWVERTGPTGTTMCLTLPA